MNPVTMPRFGANCRLALGALLLCLLAVPARAVDPARASSANAVGSEEAVAATPLAPAPAAAPRLKNGVVLFRQGGTQFTLTPVAKAQNPVGFYSYGVPNASSANTGFERNFISLLFFYLDLSTNPSGLSLFLIHDHPNNVAGGTATFVFNGLPPPALAVAKDDDFDGYTPDPPVAGQMTASWSWSTCCTDGVAIGGLENDPFCISIQPTFSTAIQGWVALDGPSNVTPAQHQIPNMTDTVYLCGDCIDLACPATVTASCAAGGSAFVDVKSSGGSLCPGALVTNDRTAGGSDASGMYPVGTTQVTFSVTDAPGFASNCTTSVEVADDTTPPTITNCPPPLDFDCAGPSGVPLSDPRIQAWLKTFAAADDCATVTLSDDAPVVFPSGCIGSITTVTFTATDGAGNKVDCTADVTVHSQCMACEAAGIAGEPSIETSKHPLKVLGKGGQAVLVEKIGCASAYNIYADRIGSWYAPSLATGTVCDALPWKDNGDGTITLDYNIPMNTWIAVSATSCAGGSSAGRSSAGIERMTVGTWENCPAGP